MNAKIPTDVLLVRALNHFERAKLELEAGHMFDPIATADAIDKGMALLRQVMDL